MQHEKVIVRPDKSKIMLKVSINISSYGSDAGVKWEWDIYYCAPGKRKYGSVYSTNDYEYRRQPFPEGRRKWAEAKMYEYISKEEVLEAKLELWEKLKPTL